MQPIVLQGSKEPPEESAHPWAARQVEISEPGKSVAGNQQWTGHGAPGITNDEERFHGVEPVLSFLFLAGELFSVRPDACGRGGIPAADRNGISVCP